MDASGALVLFSGGQDSTTCLAWALERYDRVETIGFDYGQRHRIELQCREHILAEMRLFRADWAKTLADDHTIDLTSLGQISDTALTRDIEIEAVGSSLPNTFVPGRNLIFLTFAAAVAYRRNLKHIVGGMCETDYSGYPDCRDDTIKALQVTLNLGMDRRFVLETPLMRIDKAATWRLAQTLGGTKLVKIIIEESHTCYRGERGERHSWGFGCASCPACELRAEGYRRFRAEAAEKPLEVA